MNVKQLKLLQNVNFNYWFARQKIVRKYGNKYRCFFLEFELYTKTIMGFWWVVYIRRALAYKLNEWRECSFWVLMVDGVSCCAYVL